MSNEGLHILGLRQMGSLNCERVTTVTAAAPNEPDGDGEHWQLASCYFSS
jgi:hypothetical protein